MWLVVSLFSSFCSIRFIWCLSFTIWILNLVWKSLFTVNKKWSSRTSGNFNASHVGSKIHFAVVALGSEGDIRPFVAVGVALLKHGHKVTVFAEASFEQLIRENNLEFHLLKNTSVKKNMKKCFLTRFVQAGDSIWTVFRKYFSHAKFNEHQTRNVFSSCVDGCARLNPDAIIFGTFSCGAYDIAESLRIPAILLYVAPKTPSSHLPLHLLQLKQGHLLTKVGFINKFLYYFYDWIAWRPLRALFNEFREQHLSLSRLPAGIGPRWRSYKQNCLTIYLYSQYVIPRPQDWRHCDHIVGWVSDNLTHAEWEPPPELVQFLENGSPPFYIGFGSMMSEKDLMKLVLEVVRKSGIRAVIYEGWGTLESKTPDQKFSNILQIPFTPHSWLFPKCAAVIHHGGSGTTVAALRAGVPSIVCPFAFDQQLFGESLEKLNVAPAPILHKNLSTDLLTNAIRQVLENYSEMKGNAETLMTKINSEIGQESAANVILENLSLSPFHLQ